MRPLILIFALTFALLSCNDVNFVPNGGPQEDAAITYSSNRFKGEVVTQPQQLKAANKLTLPFNTGPMVMFTTPVYYKCGEKTFFIRKLAQSGAVLRPDGEIDFVHPSDPAFTQNRRAYANALGIFSKVALLNENGTAIVRQYALNLATSDLTQEKGTFYSAEVNSLACSESGQIYLVAKKMKVVKNSLASSAAFQTVPLRETGVFQLTLSEQSSTVDLELKKTIPDFEASQSAVKGNSLFLVELSGGQLIAVKLGIPSLEITDSNVFRIHHGEEDNYPKLVLGTKDNLYILAEWHHHNNQHQLEILELNTNDLEPNLDIVTNSYYPGEDHVLDMVKDMNHIQFVSSILPDSSALMIFGKVNDNGAQKSILMRINEKSGQLDKGFHQTGFEMAPGDSARIAKWNQTYLLFYGYGDLLGLRAIDQEGALTRINKEKDLKISEEGGGILQVVQVGDKFRVYFSRGSLFSEDLIHFYEVSLK